MTRLKLKVVSTLMFSALSLPLAASEICQEGLALSYVSAEALEGGLTADGPELTRWTLQFNYPEVIWSHADMVEKGTLVCRDGEIVAEFSQHRLEVIIVREPQQIEVAGVVYTLSSAMIEP